jgi:hypothetical protein
MHASSEWQSEEKKRFNPLLFLRFFARFFASSLASLLRLRQSRCLPFASAELMPPLCFGGADASAEAKPNCFFASASLRQSLSFSASAPPKRKSRGRAKEEADASEEVEKKRRRSKAKKELHAPVLCNFKSAHLCGLMEQNSLILWMSPSNF